MAAVPIVQWLEVSTGFDWSWIILGGLACGSLLGWKLAPAARRRVRFVWALLVAALLLRMSGALPAAPHWIREAELAFEQLAALHLIMILLFQMALKRWQAPRILSDLAIGVGYIVIFLSMLTRVGVNLAGIIATSAVATAVIGFGLQDLLGNLASGLALEMEQAIVAGDWIRTEQYMGQVRTVRLRHTAIETPDGDTVLAPNSALTRVPVTVLGRTAAQTCGVKHRRLVTFQLPYGPSPASVVEAVEQALAASPVEGIATEPKARCVVVEFHPQHVQYGALVWMMRPGLEYLDISNVRTRISFALARMGEPLVAIPYLLDHRHEAAPQDEAGMTDRLAALRRIDIFRSLGDEELRPLASGMKSESFAPGEVILRQGDDGGSAYLVRSGRVRITLSHGSGLSEQIACVEPGGFFGEMSLLTGEPRTATALALEQADCYRLSKSDLDPLFARHPDLAGDIAALLTARQAGLAAAREKMGADAERQREAESNSSLLTRIRRYFAIG
jgi:small-conductance mechanosensitive channel/CRP-like cAMP-binding protein